MTNIVITGSTGVLGRRVVRELTAAGHRVTGVTRSARGRALLEGFGARAVEADVYDRGALTAAFADADAVVNLLTRIPSVDRVATPGAWDENDRLRTEASAAVAEAAEAAGAGRLVQESLAFTYADGGDAWLDEAAPVAATGRTATALVAEANAQARFSGEAVVLRFGLFAGPDSDSRVADIESARAGISPTLGRRDAYLPMVWLDDAATAVVAALSVPRGIYNVTDADPPTRGEIDAALGALIGQPALQPALDEIPPALDPLARSQRVSTRKLREAGRWEPRVRAGIDGWRLIAERPLAA